MPNVFDINSTFLNIFGYPLSYLEFIGTVFGLWCVVLTARERVLAWPIGIVNIVFFFVLFYQIQLYSDMLLQLYFFATSIYGWWKWTHPDPLEARSDNALKVRTNSRKVNIIWFCVILACIAALGTVMRSIHLYLPSLFPEPAAFPYWDAATTVMSIIAQWFLTKKILESWFLWISVDVICVVLYLYRNVLFLSLEYLIFLIISVCGLISWLKAIREQEMRECAAA